MHVVTTYITFSYLREYMKVHYLKKYFKLHVRHNITATFNSMLVTVL